jgi:hypothetical protein
MFTMLRNEIKNEENEDRNIMSGVVSIEGYITSGAGMPRLAQSSAEGSKTG